MSSAPRVPTDPRISRRRQALARGRRRRLFARTVALAAVALAGWAAFGSTLLEVREVRVIGARHASEGWIAAATGLGADDNLLLLSTAEVAARAESVPWVRRVEVTRVLPGTVIVRVAERRPALVLSSGGARWTIDGAGHVLARGRIEPGLPVLAGSGVGAPAPGTRLSGPAISGALRAWRSMPRGLRARVVAAYAPTIERISFSFAGGVTVRYGAANRLRAKHAVLRALLARVRAERREAAYIDVRVPERPALSAAPPSPRRPG